MDGVRDDNSFDNLTPLTFEILGAVAGRSMVKSISFSVKRPASNVSRTLKKLKFLGLVDKRQGLYFLTSWGIAALRSQGLRVSDNSLDGSNGVITRRMRSRLRAHDVSFVLRFWKVPEGWDKLRGLCFGWEVSEESDVWSEREVRRLYGDLLGELKDARFNDEFRGGGSLTLKFEEYTVVCNASSLRVWIPEVVTDSADMAARETVDKLREFIPRLERLLRLPAEALWKNGRLNVRTSSAHYAWVDSAFAKYALRETSAGETGFRVRDKVDGKTRVLIDRSNGGYEFEATHPGYVIEDSEILDGMVRPYIEGRAYMPDVVSDELDKVKETLSVMDPTLREFAAQMEAHVGTAKANYEAAQAIRETVLALNVLLRPLIILGSWLERLRRWILGDN
jgi:hypothetical protein